MPVIVHVLSTLLQLLGLVVVIGGVVTSIGLIPRTDSDSGKLRTQIAFLLGPALLTLTLGVGLVLIVRSSMMGGESFSQLLPVLPVVLLQTHFGFMWLVRFSGLVFLWVSWGLLILTKKNYFAALMFCVAALIAWTISGVGHSAGLNGFSWRQWVDWMHIIAASLWGGSMIIVALTLSPLARGNRLFLTISKRLSHLAAGAFAAVLATGIINTEHQLHAVSDFVTTDYGRILLLKLVFVAAMLGCAATNRLLFLPRLQDAGSQGAGFSVIDSKIHPISLATPHDRSNPSVSFLRLLRLEILFMIGVLTCVAVLRHGPPPPHHHRLMVTKNITKSVEGV